VKTDRQTPYLSWEKYKIDYQRERGKATGWLVVAAAAVAMELATVLLIVQLASISFAFCLFYHYHSLFSLPPPTTST